MYYCELQYIEMPSLLPELEGNIFFPQTDISLAEC